MAKYKTIYTTTGIYSHLHPKVYKAIACVLAIVFSAENVAKNACQCLQSNY